MDFQTLMLALIVIPLATGVVMALLPARVPHAGFATLHVASLGVECVIALTCVAHVITTGDAIWAMGLWFHLDVLGSIFVALIGIIGFLTGLYAVSYIAHDVEIGHMTSGKVKQFYLFFSLFIFTMMLVATSNNIILMWVGIEATTLSTVFLVGAYDTKLSLEAAWKYIIVCTAGVAFGLYATLLIYANAADVMSNPHEAVFWTEVLPWASQLDVMLVDIAFVFAAIGFGTKAGLFPMHTWLPDAHSEAPSPVSGLLSGVLLKCAILVIIRFYILVSQAAGSELPQMIMLILGCASVVIAALAVFSQDDLKRKLAYSSCENVGLIALFLGFGGPLGIAAALLHCVMHGLTKALMFCLSGNVMMRYNTRDLNKISGVLKVMPTTATLMVVGLFALSGFPPFALFVSEITGITAGIVGGQWIVLGIVVLALTIVVAAFAQVVHRAVMGKAPEGMEKHELKIGALIPEVVLAAVILWFGVALPQPVLQGVEGATAIVMQGEPTELHEAPLFRDLFGESSSSAHNTQATDSTAWVGTASQHTADAQAASSTRAN